MRTSSSSSVGLFVALVLIAAGSGSACNDDDTAVTPPPSTGGNDNAVVQVVDEQGIASDTPGSTTTDPELVNAWGLAFNPRGFAWVSAAETGLSTVYDAAGAHVIPSVHMPPCREERGSPTGQVFNDTPEAFKGDSFIFVTEQGTIAGWQIANGTEAILRVSASACDAPTAVGGATPTALTENEPVASFKGATIAKINSTPYLYVANFRAATVDVFDASYAPVHVDGQFTDPAIPPDFAPFNVQEVDGKLIVTYARQDSEKEDDVRGPGNGYVNLYEPNGTLVGRLVSGGVLNSPWGVTKTPATFGTIPNRLLIGNFGDGMVHVFKIDPIDGLARLSHEGTLGDGNANPVVIEGLWALRFGVDAGGFRSDVLYFTAGPMKETHGAFGRLSARTINVTDIPTPMPTPTPTPNPTYP